jgi:hypothetical protein
MYYNNGSAQTEVLNKEFSDGDKMSINGRAGKVDNIYGVSYEYTNGNTWTPVAAVLPVNAIFTLTSTADESAVIAVNDKLTISTLAYTVTNVSADGKTITLTQDVAANLTSIPA